MGEGTTSKEVRVNVNPLLLCLAMFLAGAAVQASVGVFPSRSEGCQCSKEVTPVHPVDHQKKIGSTPESHP